MSNRGVGECAVGRWSAAVFDRLLRHATVVAIRAQLPLARSGERQVSRSLARVRERLVCQILARYLSFSNCQFGRRGVSTVIRYNELREVGAYGTGSRLDRT